MRSVLTARVSDDPDVSRRITVVAGAAPQAVRDLEGPVDGFVCGHMLGHLDPVERVATFEAVLEKLTDTGVGVATIEPAPDVTAGDAALGVEQRRFGRYDYRVTHHPAADAHTYVSEYEVREGSRLIRRERFAGHWQPVGLDDLRGDVEPLGLTVTPTDSRTVLLHRRQAGVTVGSSRHDLFSAPRGTARGGG